MDPSFSCGPAARNACPPWTLDVVAAQLCKDLAMTDSFRLLVHAEGKNSCCDESTEARGVCVGSFEREE